MYSNLRKSFSRTDFIIAGRNGDRVGHLRWNSAAAAVGAPAAEKRRLRDWGRRGRRVQDYAPVVHLVGGGTRERLFGGGARRRRRQDWASRPSAQCEAHHQQ